MTTTFPRRVTLEFTNHCNLHCVFCPRRFMEKETGFLDVTLARELMTQMQEVQNCQKTPVAVVPFFRGESLLHPQWDILLASLHEFQLGPIQMATNASLLSEERAHRLLDIGLETLSFSMDTIDPELYHRLRGSDYHTSLDNVLRFLALRENTPQGCTTVQVSAVRTADNAAHLKDFVDFWQPRVDRIRIYPEHSADGNPGSLTQGAQTKDSPRTACHKVMEDMVIYWNGDVALCNHDWRRRITGPHLGSVRKNTLADIWTGPAYSAVRAAHAAGNLENVPPCEHCHHWRDTPMGETIIGENHKLQS